MFKNYAASSYKEILLHQMRGPQFSLDRMAACGAVGRGFKSLWTHTENSKKRKIDPAEFDPDNPADNQRKEAYDSVDTSED